jgi:hypothetical protein
MRERRLATCFSRIHLGLSPNLLSSYVFVLFKLSPAPPCLRPKFQSYRDHETRGPFSFHWRFFLERISVDLFRARLHSSSLSKFIRDVRMKGGCAGSSNRIGTDATLDLVEELPPSYFAFASSFMSTRVGVRRTDRGKYIETWTAPTCNRRAETLEKELLLVHFLSLRQLLWPLVLSF